MLRSVSPWVNEVSEIIALHVGLRDGSRRTRKKPCRIVSTRFHMALGMRLLLLFSLTIMSLTRAILDIQCVRRQEPRQHGTSDDHCERVQTLRVREDGS